MTSSLQTVGDVLRFWRTRRRLSQLSLALEADVSARHLSFVESGRASPSRELLLRLAEPLGLSLRERQRLLQAAGYAPALPDMPLDASDRAVALAAVSSILSAHEPFPAVAVDRHWNLLAANAALLRLVGDVDPELLEPPVNMLRLSLSADGLAPAIFNLAEWRGYVLDRLRREADIAADETLERLHAELEAWGGPAPAPRQASAAAVAIPLIIRDPESGRPLTFLSTTTVFGSATDVSLPEVTLEAFYPADEETRAALLQAARAGSSLEDIGRAV